MIAEVQCDDVRVIDLEEDLFFGVEMHELVLLKNFLLSHDFESVDIIFASKLNEFNPSEGTVAESCKYLEIVSL